MAGYLDPVIQRYLMEGASPISFASGMGAARLDQLAADESMQRQDAFQQQVALQPEPKRGYLDDIYQNVNQDYFLDSAGMPRTDNIHEFTQAGRTYSDDADSKMARLQYEWDARNQRDAAQNQHRSEEGALNRGLRSVVEWMRGANQGTGALNAPQNAAEFEKKAAPFLKPATKAPADTATTPTAAAPADDYADYAKRFRLKHPNATDDVIKRYYAKRPTGVK